MSHMGELDSSKDRWEHPHFCPRVDHCSVLGSHGTKFRIFEGVVLMVDKADVWGSEGSPLLVRELKQAKPHLSIPKRVIIYHITDKRDAVFAHAKKAPPGKMKFLWGPSKTQISYFDSSR